MSQNTYDKYAGLPEMTWVVGIYFAMLNELNETWLVCPGCGKHFSVIHNKNDI